MSWTLLALFACETPRPALAESPEPAAAPSAVETSAPIAAGARAEIGQPAPDFTLKGVDGAPVSLSDYAGKTVILEWFNPDCPFIRYAHSEGGPLASWPNALTDEGYVYLAINSGSPGKQGTGLERNLAALEEYGMRVPLLLDESGAVGQAYGAQTTPHMYVVDAGGALVYNGALDDAPLGRGAKRAVNYVESALSDLRAGEAVQNAQTKPYGCSVKYGS